jgi:hypothetical protein
MQGNMVRRRSGAERLGYRCTYRSEDPGDSAHPTGLFVAEVRILRVVDEWLDEMTSPANLDEFVTSILQGDTARCSDDSRATPSQEPRYPRPEQTGSLHRCHRDRHGPGPLGRSPSRNWPRPRLSSATTTPEQHNLAKASRAANHDRSPADGSGQEERDAEVREPILPPKAGGPGDRPLRPAPPVKPSRVSKGGLETKLHASSPNGTYGS